MNRDTSTQDASDPRFTLNLLHDLREVLAKHRYVASDDPRAHSNFVVCVLDLAAHFEGKV